MEHQTRLFILVKGVKDSKSIYRLKRGWRLSFACDASLQTHNVRLFWNLHPSTTLSSFDDFEELQWIKNDKLSEGYEFITIPKVINTSGTFRFFYTLDGSSKQENCDGFGYLIVDPNLTVGKDDELISMDSLQLHTVLPKLLGPFVEWRDRLLVSYRTGYNVIHFTPLQSLNAETKSSYSIKDQLQLNPSFSSSGLQCTLQHVGDLVKFMKEEWKVLSITDMVYNHTANDSGWLMDHPESAYNLFNSAHLKPAYILDRFIHHTSQAVGNNELKELNIPMDIRHVEHLHALRDYLSKEVQKLKLQEFYIIDIEEIVSSFTLALEEVIRLSASSAKPLNSSTKPPSSLTIQQDAKFRRFKSSVNIKDILQFYTDDILKIQSSGNGAAADLTNMITSDLQQRLEKLNQQKVDEVNSHLEVAVDNVIKGVDYRFVSDQGRKLDSVTDFHPLVSSYFINKKAGFHKQSFEDDCKGIDDAEKAKYMMAHNGWVMGDDPLKNFAEPGSNVYLRRELVSWSDSVKLRYGEKPADSPYLWQRMEEYTRQTVDIFHGIRLDNCHSTPIHVAEHMMRYARCRRPDLYVMAELFTSHEDIDNLFVNKLGINSLIREGMTAWDAHEQGRLVYRYGGRPVGSFVQPNMQILKPAVAHALFMDVSHDNPSIIEKRNVYDGIPLAAYIAMSCCATGSNRGHDELVPHHIDVVLEDRVYTSWSRDRGDNHAGLCSLSTGITEAKQVLNNLHQYMGDNNFDQVYVHDLSDEVVSITRHNPLNHHSYICVVRSTFNLHSSDHPHCDHLTFEGRLDSVKLYGKVVESGTQETFIKHFNYVNGLKSHQAELQTDVSIEDIPGMSWKKASETKETISFENFPPGTVLVISVLPNTDLVAAQTELLTYVTAMYAYVAGDLLTSEAQDIDEMMSKLTLADLNDIMYHCEAEEKSLTGYGSYNIPGYSSFVYTGLQGLLSPMARIRAENDLGHPICQNIRDGDWLVDYITSRLMLYDTIPQFAEFTARLMGALKLLPRYLMPCYLDIALVALSFMINHTVWSKMNSFVMDGRPFIRELALSSQQFCAILPSAKLAKLSAKLETEYQHSVTGQVGLVSIAAGLPHFSEGLMRIWGRDTFISLRGLLLVTGRYHDARAIILSFAGTLRHGLIPNLHGEGVHARYNCRDAVWWWLQAIQDYCRLAPNGHKILADDVLRMYPSDDCEPDINGRGVQPLFETMQEVLQCHADGIEFRERNAGPSIDEHMTYEGFNVAAGIDWNTGFVYGGNEANCGTWMDKMGSSSKAGNKGKPATPRNGSAVELVGLCASAVHWLADMHKRKLYKYEGVSARRVGWEQEQLVGFDIWYELIKRNFEKYFWVDGTHSTMAEEHNPQLINKKDIYKDCVGATPEWCDYQLRPNYPIAMVVAPGLFTAANAAATLDVAEEHLLGPLGMKTLDKSDWTYNGDYINSDDSDQYNTAKGFNYHNGPEWLWPLGYFMRAKLIFAKRLESQQVGSVDTTIQWIERKLSAHHLTMLSTDWRSLPELTNTNGSVCGDSCPAQAWSISCILDVLYDIEKAKQ